MNMKTFRGPILTLTLVGLTSACTPHDDVQEPATPPEVKVEAAESPKKPEPEPEEETVTVAVASVQLQDDCPTPAAKVGAGARAESAPSLRPTEVGSAGDVPRGDVSQPFGGCVQSEVQLSIVSEDSKALPFSIRSVRLRKSEDTATIETMQARAPRIWGGSTYGTWDESIAAGSTLNVRYALGAPDWAAVERVLGGRSWDQLYVVELQVEVAGRLQTITSPLAPREAVEVMVT